MAEARGDRIARLIRRQPTDQELDSLERACRQVTDEQLAVFEAEHLVYEQQLSAKMVEARGDPERINELLQGVLDEAMAGNNMAGAHILSVIFGEPGDAEWE